ncbi:hypothetical protein [uncultured Methanobrevibacter sp.]|uniref:hypothetical protein n=1 Tax=uncultured Methanobrevibacter sp. TaxID=253161 RepID=UPI002621C695|nr:hypothetical protein [uncultured Methanobrevibacter sp.]
MDIFGDVNFKALVFGAGIAGGFILFGWQISDWLYPFASIGLLYAGYGQKNVLYATICGAIASTAIIVLTFQGYMGQFDGFFITENGLITVALTILIVGAFVGFVGGWAKRSRLKAMEQYEKQQKIGKKKNKKKKANVKTTKAKNGYVDKIFKK